MERISQGEPEGPSAREIAAERSSHGDLAAARGLARPRKDKAAIFDVSARTIIITDDARCYIYMYINVCANRCLYVRACSWPGCGSPLYGAREKTKLP